MDSYITGNTIKKLRRKLGITQSSLAEKLNISDKTVSKWETGKGYPDITLIEQLARELNVSVAELLSGNTVINENRGFNMKRSFFYVCPVCGNFFASAGKGTICCHGITLPPEEPEEEDDRHQIHVEIAEDEYYVTVNHEMTKEHYISFLAAVSDNGIMITKLYPEGNAETRFKKNRTCAIYAYCNRHGLFKKTIR